MTTRESEWTEEDLAWAIAYQDELAERCPACRLPLSETTAMAGGRPVHTYRADEPARCYACDAIAKAIEKAGDTQRPQALLYQARRTCSC
ncbi:hypothetical protein ACFOY2_05395 [Nonomuraea purpurea]|uniref:Uncharacterized protein n=1 Tax=Nonomuraea purpurea TaxID=1849276 RepID=A0ABV8G0W8_9ACTN